MTRIKIHISNVKLPFYPPCEVKYRLQNGVSTVASKRDSLCMMILRAKYKVKNDWLRSEASKRASPIWKAIESTKGIISKGACYLIGDG